MLNKKTIKKTIKYPIYIITKYYARILYILASHIINPNKNIILFESSNGRNYTGNPRYIYEEILNQGLDKEFKCVWSLAQINTQIPGNPIKVKRSFFRFLYYTLRSGAWIFDSRHLYYLRKNEKTKYIQTWHGTPLKKLALDMDYIDMAGNKNIKEYHEEFKKNTKTWQYLISQNEYSTEIFKRAFDFKGEILEIGYPRNDILINNNTLQYISKIKTKFNIPKNKKIILYAPTWRDNEYYQRGEYKFATKMDFNKMYAELNNEYILIVKFHYLVKENINWDNYKEFIIECNEDWDIQELYLISDMLITDYSSVMFDYSILKKPIIFYTYDLENYENNIRNFYFDMTKEVPGPICKTNTELINFIKNYNEEDYNREYAEKYEKFNKKFNPYDNGKSSKRIIELIKK